MDACSKGALLTLWVPRLFLTNTQCSENQETIQQFQLVIYVTRIPYMLVTPSLVADTSFTRSEWQRPTSSGLPKD